MKFKFETEAFQSLQLLEDFDFGIIYWLAEKGEKQKKSDDATRGEREKVICVFGATGVKERERK